MKNSKTIDALFQSLQDRQRPEDIALLVDRAIGPSMSVREQHKLAKATRNALQNTVWGYTSMLQTFAKPIGAERQIKKAIELFELSKLPSLFKYDDVLQIEGFMDHVAPMIGMTSGQSDYMHDRLNRAEREALGLEISRRRYNKLFRQLARIDSKLYKLIREQKKGEFQMIAKHGLAHHIPREEFEKDLPTACFIAYYTARCNRRSEFTISSQSKPYDEISDMLFHKAANGTPNYWAIAHVYPAPHVLEQLSEKQKGELLGKWTLILEEIASMLRDVWNLNDFNKQTMIVRKGNDSSTWNLTAGAWNKARDAWINLIYALGAAFILEEMCFGKVMRLMAGDVAYFHQLYGGGIDANTIVWNELPFPWEVFQGEATCTRKMVEAACKAAHLSPKTSGWIMPRKHGVVRFTPTPELVHGVAVWSPFLANTLKKHKYYSGKKVKPFLDFLN